MSKRWKSPVNRWRFENNANDSVGSRDGTASNVTYSSSSQKEGSYSAVFNGSSSGINLGTPTITSTAVTMSAWIKTTETTIAMAVLSKDTTDRGFLFAINDSALYLEVNGSITLSKDSGRNNLSDGQWHHVLVTGDSTIGWKGYVDGSLDKQSAWASIPTTTAEAYIGRRVYPGFPSYFNGNLDDVRVYDVALTPTEVQELYNSYYGTQLWETPLYRWKLDNNASDIYGRKNGTATSMTYGTTDVKEGSHSATFNGSTSYIHVDGLNPYIYTSYTWSFWVKAPASGQQSMLELAQSDSSANRWAVRNDGLGGSKLLFYAYNNGVIVVNSLSLATVFDDTWHHVVYVDVGGDFQFYVDGALDLSGSYTRFSDGNQRMTFGKLRFNLFSGYFLNGEMDDIRLYNVALSAADVKNLYDSYNHQPLWNYVSRWKLDGSGNDSGPAGNDGTATSVTWQTYPKVGGYKSAFFAGVDSVVKPSYINILSYASFSVSMWFMCTDATSSNQMLFSESNTTLGTYPRYALYLSSFAGGHGVRLYIHSGSAVLIDSRDQSKNYADGKWHFIVLIDNNGSVSSYFDGKAGSLSGSYTRSAFGRDTTTIGKQELFGLPDQNPLTGNIDDVRFYNYALTADQVGQLYNSYHGQYGLAQGTII